MAVCRDREEVSERWRKEIRELLFSEEFYMNAMLWLAISHGRESPLSGAGTQFPRKGRSSGLTEK